MQIRREKQLTIWGLAVVLLAGCEEAGIRSYRVPKPVELESTSPHRDNSAQRMLAAIIPRGNRTWFFKLLGPAGPIGEHKASFEQLIRSVRFDDQAEPPVTWTLPDGWRQQAGPGMRFATLTLGPQEQPLELTVTPLARQGQAGDVAANVNRWREQLGLEPIAAAALGRVATPLQLDGATATLVDMTGPGQTDRRQ